MSVQSEESTITYLGNGSSVVAYPIPFKFFRPEHLRVYVVIDGVAVDLILASDYFVTGAGIDGEAELRTAVPYSGSISITINRDSPKTNPYIWEEGNRLPMRTLEENFDWLTLATQDAARQADQNEERAVRVAKGEIVNELPSAEARKGRIFGFDPATGQPTLISGPLLTDITAIENAVDQSQASAIVAAANAAAANVDAERAEDAAEVAEAARVAIAGRTARVYNVKESPYNAMVDGVTDDTAAINAAINAAYAAGGGTVWLPNGHYRASGPLNPAINGILGPTNITPQTAYTEEQVHVQVVGESKGWLDLTNAGYGGGVVIDASTAPTTGTQYFSVFSTGKYVKTEFNAVGCKLYNIMLSIDRMLILVPPNPSISGINYSNAAGADLRDQVAVVAKFGNTGIPRFTGWGAWGPVNPTTGGGSGIILPQALNNKRVVVGAVNVTGFYNGIVSHEHTQFRSKAIVAYCARGLVLPGGHHLAAVGSLTLENNIVDIVADTGVSTVNITVDIEKGNAGSNPGAWWHNTSNVRAVNGGTIRGKIDYTAYPAGGGEGVDLITDDLPNLLTTNLVNPPIPIPYSDPADYIAEATQGAGGWYYGLLTTRNDISTFTTAGLYLNTELLQWQGSGYAATPIISPIYIHPKVVGSPPFAGAVSAARQWIASESKTLTIRGSSQRSDASGDGVDVRIYKNNDLIYLRHAMTESSATNYNVKVSVVSGDKLTFVADCISTGQGDGTGFSSVLFD